MFRFDEEKDFWIWLLIVCVIGYFLMIVTNCMSIQKNDKPVPIITNTPISSTTTTTTKPIVNVYPSLSWENTTQPHPERIPWSKILIDEINKNFVSLDKVKDMGVFCPKYSSLSKDKKVQVWGELFVWLAYAESGFDPQNASPDVGQWYDKRTWSTGLWQISACDVENYNLKSIVPSYSFEDLKTVEPNAKLALALMAKQIDKNGLIVQSNFSNVYWATLYHGKYDEIDMIAGKVKKLEFCK